MVSILSVVVRFHDLTRLFELRRCIFSLVCQSYEALEICLVTQRFSESDRIALREFLSPLMALNESVLFEICNFSEDLPLDARSALINLGIDVACGRYLAFLDHDDTILSSGYPQLIKELERSSAAIAFASIAYKDVDVFQDVLLVDRRLEAFVGKTLADLFDHNFCPIHSFVIDRTKVDPSDLWFDTTLNKHEDYEFLLRFCSKYPSSFHLIGTFVGDYYLKNDDSNTNIWLSGGTDDSLKEWQQSSQLLKRRKSELTLSPAVQKEPDKHVMMGDDDHP